jgi:hypothetical protein
LNFVLLFLGISEGDSNITVAGNLETHVAAESRTLDQLQTNGVATDLSSVEPSVSHEQWNTVVSKHRHNLKSSRDTFQQSIVATVYVDQSVKNRRETSLIITGLASKDNLSDSQLISDLCVTEFNIVPNIVSTKRLGRLHMDKVQPILVYLKEVEQARFLIGSAKRLRRSPDPITRERIFINPNLTRAEAAAAYQVRVQQRSATQRRIKLLDGANVATASSSHEVDPACANNELLSHRPLNPAADSFNLAAAPVLTSGLTN